MSLIHPHIHFPFYKNLLLMLQLIRHESNSVFTETVTCSCRCPVQGCGLGAPSTALAPSPVLGTLFPRSIIFLFHMYVLILLKQCFSSFSVHQNHLTQDAWGAVQESAFLTSPQMQLLPPGQGPYIKNPTALGFPGGAVVKNLPANAGDTGSSPGPGRSHRPWSN